MKAVAPSHIAAGEETSEAQGHNGDGASKFVCISWPRKVAILYLDGSATANLQVNEIAIAESNKATSSNLL